MMMEEPRLAPIVLTRYEAARAAKIGLSSLDELIKQQAFPVVQLGRRVLIPADTFARYLRRRAQRRMSVSKHKLGGKGKSPDKYIQRANNRRYGAIVSSRAEIHQAMLRDKLAAEIKAKIAARRRADDEAESAEITREIEAIDA